MKKYFIIAALVLTTQVSFGQTYKSYKTATAANKEERTSILDQMRNHIYVSYDMLTKFSVKTLNVNEEYAWLMVTVIREDGKPIVLTEPDADCCHAEALYQKIEGNWTMVEKVAFSSDVWYEALSEKYNLPKSFFVTQ
jgi:hypothetical protein